MAQPNRLALQIARSEEVAAWVVASGRKVAIREAVRSSLVVGCIQLAIEHHAATVSLAKSRQYASLLALSRSVYESYIWATWLFRIASDAQLLDLAHNRLSRPLEKMVRDLDRAGFFEDPMFDTMKPIIDKMNGFVHGGFEQLRHRIRKGEVGPFYDEQLIIDALQIADMFAIMALLEGPAVSNDEALGDQFFEESKRFQQPAPGTQGPPEDTAPPAEPK